MSGEVLLPQARDEFGNSCGRMLTDTLEDVDQISVGVDDVQPASHNHNRDAWSRLQKYRGVDQARI